MENTILTTKRNRHNIYKTIYDGFKTTMFISNIPLRQAGLQTFLCWLPKSDKDLRVYHYSSRLSGNKVNIPYDWKTFPETEKVMKEIFSKRINDYKTINDFDTLQSYGCDISWFQNDEEREFFLLRCLELTK